MTQVTIAHREHIPNGGFTEKNQHDLNSLIDQLTK